MTARGGANVHDRVLRIERLVNVVLRVGVLASLAVIVAGMLLIALHHPKLLVSHYELSRLVVPGAAFPHTLAEVAQGIAALQGTAVVTAGLLLLLLLPVMRVALTGLIFIHQKDWIFVFITAAVLALLLLSLVLGRAG